MLNVLLFVPLGVGLALSGIAGKRAVLTACILSAIIETTQLFFIPGRDATLGDVLTNTLGGSLGFAIARTAGIWLRPKPRIAIVLGLCWCAVWITIQTVSSIAFTPSLPESGYFGQIAPRLGNFEVFSGRVLATRIDDVALTDTRLNDAASIRRRLLRGATVGATVLPDGPTNDIAPIVRVADDEQREIVLLAQDDQSLLFGLRTRAAILRLRSPLFAVAGVFAHSRSTKNSSGVSTVNRSANDSVSLAGSYDGRLARLTAQTNSASDERRVRVSSSLGWTLTMPFQWLIEDTLGERVLSWIWMAFLMAPAGYWGAHIVLHRDPHANSTLVVLCLTAAAAILLAGLVAVEQGFGLPVATVRDWVASVSGIVAGGVLACVFRNTHTRKVSRQARLS